MKHLSLAAVVASLLLPFAASTTDVTPARQGVRGKDATLTVSNPAGYGQLDASTTVLNLPSPIEPTPDPGICMANGGMPFTATPVSIEVNGWKAFNTATLSGFGLAALTAKGSYVVSIGFDGKASTFTVSCDGRNEGFVSDACDATSTVNVGRGSFAISVVANITARTDAVGGRGPYSASGFLSQTNCK